MSRFQLSVNPSRAWTPLAEFSASSASCASRAHVDEFYEKLCDLMLQISANQPRGALALLAPYVDGFNTAVQNAYNTALTAAGGAIALAADPRPAVPAGLPAEVTAVAQALFDALNATIAADMAAAPAAAPARSRVLDFVQISQQEFDAFFMEGMINLAHSGFPSQSNFKQVIRFRLLGCPAAPFAHSCTLNDFVAELPDNVTPFNMGAAHVNMLYDYASKTEGFMFDWGRRHNLPDALRCWSFPCWRFVTKKQLSAEQYTAMRSYSAAAIRDAQTVDFSDPAELGASSETAREYEAARLERLQRRRTLRRTEMLPDDVAYEAYRQQLFQDDSDARTERRSTFRPRSSRGDA